MANRIYCSSRPTSPPGICWRRLRVLYEIRADYRSKTDGKTSLENRNAGGLFFAARYFYLWRIAYIARAARLLHGVFGSVAREFFTKSAPTIVPRPTAKIAPANRNAGRLFLLRDISIYSESHLLREPRDFSTGYLAAAPASFHQIRAVNRSLTDGKNCASKPQRRTALLLLDIRIYCASRATSPRGIWQRCARVFHEMRAVNRSQTGCKN